MSVFQVKISLQLFCQISCNIAPWYLHRGWRSTNIRGLRMSNLVQGKIEVPRDVRNSKGP